MTLEMFPKGASMDKDEMGLVDHVEHNRAVGRFSVSPSYLLSLGGKIIAMRS
jgi:hypothetical protein